MSSDELLSTLFYCKFGWVKDDSAKSLSKEIYKDALLRIYTLSHSCQALITETVYPCWSRFNLTITIKALLTFSIWYSGLSKEGSSHLCLFKTAKKYFKHENDLNVSHQMWNNRTVDGCGGRIFCR